VGLHLLVQTQTLLERVVVQVGCQVGQEIGRAAGRVRLQMSNHFFDFSKALLLNHCLQVFDGHMLGVLLLGVVGFSLRSEQTHVADGGVGSVGGTGGEGRGEWEQSGSGETLDCVHL
jgi:hypothetical protein